MATGLAPALARKVAKTLEIRTESPEISAALTTLSSFQGDTLSSRQSLKAEIEGRAVSLNEEYLAAAGPLIEALGSVQSTLDSLREDCAAAQQAIGHAKESSAGLLSATERFQRDMQVNDRKISMVKQFLDQYQLTTSEATALQAAEIGEEFFTALDRVRSIHSNCKSLLRTHHQRAGLELMELMSTYQEAAFEKLCRWVQSECKRLSNNEGLEIEPLLQRGAQALKDRPVLFKYCAREVASARHNALFQRFIAALTKGGPGGMPRPIEMHANDPRRYLGDMLAWMHQSLASEKEFLTSLFGSDQPVLSKAESSGSLGNHAGAGASRDLDRLSLGGTPEPSGGEVVRTGFLLEKIFDSICRPLKVRIEQVLLASPPLLLCFSLSQLLGFYTNLVDKLLGNDANLTQTLASCRQLASRRFQEQLKQMGDKLLRYVPSPPKDLSVPNQFLETLQLVSSIISSFKASYDGDDGQSGEEDFAPILSNCLDPLLEAIYRSSQQLNPSAANRLDQATVNPGAQQEYLINCYSAVEQLLSGHSICASRLRQVQGEIQKNLGILVRSHTRKLLGDSGLEEIVDRMKIYTSGKAQANIVMSQDPALPAEKIAGVLQAYVGKLSDSFTQPEFRKIQIPRLRTAASQQVSASLADAYAFVYDNLNGPEAGYKENAALELAKQNLPEEVRTILGII